MAPLPQYPPSADALNDPAGADGNASPKPVLNLRERRPEISEAASPEAVAQRLQKARLRASFRTQLDASRALGIKNSTYAAHENGNRHLRRDMAEFYAEFFDVSTDWLCYGRGVMERQDAQTAQAARPGGASAVEAPSPGAVSRASTPLSPGLAQLRQHCDPLAALALFEARSGPADLPPAHRMNGYVAELTEAFQGDAEWRIPIGIPGGNPEAPLVIRDMLRIPQDMIESGRLFAVKLPVNTLFADMPGGQRVLIDPDAVSLETEGAFIVVAEPGNRLTPVLIRPLAADPTRVAIYRSRHKRAVATPRADIENRILGRVVMVLKPFGEHDLDLLSAACREE